MDASVLHASLCWLYLELYYPKKQVSCRRVFKLTVQRKFGYIRMHKESAVILHHVNEVKELGVTKA